MTGLPLLAALVKGRCRWLKAVLLASWAAGLIADIAGADMATTVTVYASADLLIACVTVALLIRSPWACSVRLVGLLSIAMAPAHLWQSWTHGGMQWAFYVAILNAAFVLQCLIAGGLADGVARSADRLFHRLRLVRHGSGAR